MIVYSEQKHQFLSDVLSNQIHLKLITAIDSKLGKRVSQSEISSWRNSLQFMSGVLNDSRIPSKSVVSIEFNVPGTSKRIDIILSGKNSEGLNTAVIIELKQWSSVTKSEKENIVSTILGGRNVETVHPSYQAWSYSTLISDFNLAVQKKHITLKPCAYLHNLDLAEEIKSSSYSDILQKAPCFISSEVFAFKDYLSDNISSEDSDSVIDAIENGEMRPSKSLSDCVSSMLAGNEEFVMIDEQKLLYETALELASKALSGERITLIVNGGPGTGKSVVAINLLVELTNRSFACQYVSKNAAPRAVYAAKLSGQMRKSRIDNLFKGSGAFTEVNPMKWDVLIVDEAHRLNKKSGLYGNLGENQIKEIINSSKLSIFFIDENQRVTIKDIGTEAEIRAQAKLLGSQIYQTELSSQFRCNGSDGYLAFLDHALQIRETANLEVSTKDYDFRIFDDPNQMHELIVALNNNSNRARMVAGYCWDWVSKRPPNKTMDIVLPEYNYEAQWNLDKDGSLWILAEDSVTEVGCIHTCQGLELDYVGVIIGPDLIVRDRQIVTVPTARSKMDSTIKGYKKLLREKPSEANELADLIIKNTYRTLMTRGMKGCFIFSQDQETRDYFKAKITDLNV